MRKLWTVLLAVLLVTGLAFTGCGEVPEPPVQFVLEATIPADTQQDSLRIQSNGSDFQDFTITAIELTFGPITLWSLADWISKHEGTTIGDPLVSAGSPSIVLDKDAGTIAVTNGSANWQGLDIVIAQKLGSNEGLGYKGMSFNIKVTGTATPGLSFKLQGSGNGSAEGLPSSERYEEFATGTAE